MKRPEPKQEIIVKRDTILDSYLKIYLSSKRAVDWMNAEAHIFKSHDYGTSYTIGENSLNVNPCYDIDEVLEYLSHPKYDKDKPISGWKKVIRNVAEE